MTSCSRSVSPYADMRSGVIRAGWAGSTITATRVGPSLTSVAPWRTTQLPDFDSTRASATSPGESTLSAVRSARWATARAAVGRRPASQSPPGRSETQRSTPGVED